MVAADMESEPRTWLVTGGAGFIGSSFILAAIAHNQARIINLDKLTYAARSENLASVADHPRYRFVRGDIGDAALVRGLLRATEPDVIVNLAAESHVDRSIDGPAVFVATNVLGTFVLMEAAREYHQTLPPDRQARFRFLHVSTDEVYGSLGPTGAFTERSPYAPSSPYAASKAAADHLVGASFVTYGFPIIISHASNNFGRFQFPEKLIPLIITNALRGIEIPIYGDGMQVREWLSVEDHCDALRFLIRHGAIGEHYNIGSHNQRTNLELTRTICAIIDELAPGPRPYAELIRMVADRPGHDRRYALDTAKIRALGWTPAQSFTAQLRATVAWYIDNRDFWAHVDSDARSRQL